MVRRLVDDEWGEPDPGGLEAFEAHLADLERDAAAAVDRLDAAIAVRGRWLAAEGRVGRSLTVEEVVDVQATALERAEVRALFIRVADDGEPQ